MTSRQVTWTQSGHSVIVEVTADGFTAFVDGKKQNGSRIVPPTRAQKSLYDARDAAGNIGALVIYCPRAKELESIREELKAAKPVEIDPLDELRDLEEALYSASDAVRQHNDNPGIAYGKLHKAEDALSNWITTHQDIYDAEIARRKAAEQARRDSIRVDMWM